MVLFICPELDNIKDTRWWRLKSSDLYWSEDETSPPSLCLQKSCPQNEPALFKLDLVV